jgi:hypothetical protein
MSNGIVLWFIDGSLGPRTRRHILKEYPADLNDVTDWRVIAEWLTINGWPCMWATERVNGGTRIHGLRFKDMESITAFVLRWG